LTEAVTYYNTHMDKKPLLITHYNKCIDGRTVHVTQVTGERGAGKSFTAQAIANYLMLTGAEFVLVLDENGENYSLNGETGLQGYARHALPRHFTQESIDRLLIGRRDVHITIAGFVPL